MCDLDFTNDDADLKIKYHAYTHKGEEKPYKCQYCDAWFRTRHRHVVHTRIHTGEKPFPCTTCDKAFTCRGNLKSHIARIHTRDKPYQCQFCFKFFPTKTVRKYHERIHTGEKPYNCSFCKLAFPTASHRSAHVRAAHTKEKSHQCQFCTKWFGTTLERISHERIHTGEKPFSCSLCDLTFITKARRGLHIRTAHTKEKPYPCKFCTKVFSTSTEKKVHERVHTGEKPYKCPHCDKHFSNLSNKSVHVKSIHNPKPKELGPLKYQCDICPKKYRSYGSFRYHKECHFNILNCVVCGKIFQHNHSLKQHIIRMHSEGRKMHVCSYCQKPFHLEADLKSHVKIHTQEKTFVCTETGCKAKFMEAYVLKRHISGVHTDQVYPCRVCKKPLANKRSRLVHERIHTGEKPWACTFCEFRSTIASNLQRHVKYIHLNERSCICQQCGKGFVTMSSLRRHQWSHFGRKVLPCNLCGKQFQIKADRMTHLITHCKKLVIVLERILQ